jgi:hypothetical protein
MDGTEWDLKIADVAPPKPAEPDLAWPQATAGGKPLFIRAVVAALDINWQVVSAHAVELRDEPITCTIYRNPEKTGQVRYFEIRYEPGDVMKRVGPYTIAPGNTVQMTLPGRDGNVVFF